jgi:hypothetical protein
VQRDSKPIAWRPRGLSDTLDASQTFAGSMGSLQNLIPDPTTRGLFQCRPASIEQSTFSGFTTPGFISLLKVIGSYAYGMIATGRNVGQDEPFVYNLLTNAFVTISGVTAGNTPTSPGTTGAWVPPTAALIGSKLIVTHPGFNGTNGYVGILDITTPASPAWSSGNLGGAGGLSFAVPPSAVSQFNGRAWYIYNLPAQPAVIFSDSLSPLVATLGTQVLTFGDTVPLTALGQLALNNQLGGIIQSLVVFKDDSNIYQITGDASTSNLLLNALNITTGTKAPNTVVNTPKGLAFVSPDGVRQIDFFGHVSDPIGIDGQGVTVPFIYAVVPSRVAAACGGNILRISVQNGNAAGSPNQEYWYDIARQIWTGPHTFPMSLIAPYGNTFIGAPIGVTNSLWQSDPVQSGTSTFVENGVQMTWNDTTSYLPDTDKMTNNCVTESLLLVALADLIANMIVNAIDENGTVLDSVQIITPAGATIWGAFLWGGAVWAGSNQSLSPVQLPWTIPLVFARIMFQVTGQSAAGIKLGTWSFRYQMLRYLTNQLAATA